MSQLLNRVGQATATTGTGTVTLGSALSGFQTAASAGAVNGLDYTYRIEDGAAWELGYGTYSTTGPTLTRNLIASSTGSLLTLSGSAGVYSDALASDIPQNQYGACVLSLSGANLSLGPYYGREIPLGSGIFRPVPSAGVTLAPTGSPAKATTNRVITSSVATLTIGAHSIPVGAKILVEGVAGANRDSYNGPRVVTAVAATTLSFASGSATTDASSADTNGVVWAIQYIYAYWTGSAIALEASYTGYSTDTLGRNYKTGDVTRTLVGMASLNTSTAWVDTQASRMVRSWFNRNRLGNLAQATAARTLTTPTTATEIHSELRIRQLLWADEAWFVQASGYDTNSVVANTYHGIMADGTLQAGSVVAGVPPSAAGLTCVGGTLWGPITGEGGHYATPGIIAGSGNVTTVQGTSIWATKGWLHGNA